MSAFSATMEVMCFWMLAVPKTLHPTYAPNPVNMAAYHM